MGHSDESLKTDWLVMLKGLTDFADNTALHGLKYTHFKDNHIASKVIWVLVF